MNADDMKLINDIYVRLLKKGRDIYTESNDTATIVSAQKLESYSTYLGEMNDKLESILDLTDKYARECIDKATEIREYIDLNDKYKDEPNQLTLVHKEMYKGMSWADINEVEDGKDAILKSVSQKIAVKQPVNEFVHEPVMYKTISELYGKKITPYKIPITTKLNEIPAALHWYKGDQSNPPGVYICLSRGCYIQVPFPNVVDGTKDFNRTCSIKCKYSSAEECLKIRRDLSMRYNSELRACTFAHKGDSYVKIGTSFRCPNIPRFGNYAFLHSDMNELPDCDIKMMLMYALSDVLLGSLWFQNQKNTSMVMTNIDVC